MSMEEVYEDFSFMYQGRMVTVRAKTCKGFWRKLTGKMFTSSQKPIVFEFKKKILIKIHMIFVFIPLLVVWFDENKNVTKMKIMKPFGSIEDSEGKYVLEIPLKNEAIKDFEHMEN
jgi:uncharacterized membrane protein (UPF0127 family)